jgi:hypothetical protein
MTERPLYQYWPLFLALPLFLGFALYNLYCALAYGALIGSRHGDGWVSFSSRPYAFGTMLIVYILMALIFGAGFIKVVEFVLYRKGLLGPTQKRAD